jgi:hypothetical protein
MLYKLQSVRRGPLAKSGAGSVPFTWILLWLLPISASLGIAIRRRPLLGYESLRPISRHAFLTELAFAIGMQFTEAWLSIAAALVIAAAISAPHLLADPRIWLYLGVSYLAQLVLLAIVLWLLRFTTNMLLLMPAFMLPILIAPFGGALGGSDSHVLSFYVAVTLASLVMAILLTAFILYDAYRRWLTTDLA